MPHRNGLRQVQGRKEGFLWQRLMPMHIICLRIAVYVLRVTTDIRRVISVKFTTTW